MVCDGQSDESDCPEDLTKSIIWKMSAIPSSRLSALYYPYSRCVDANTLKLLAILYDEIVFVDPLDDLFREFLLSSDKGCQFVPTAVRRRWNQNQEDWQLLRDRELLRIIDPLPLIHENDQVLAAAFASDMADDAFVRLAEDEGKAAGPWKMLASRVPPSVNDSFENPQSSLPKRLREARGESAEEIRNSDRQLSDYQFGVFAWENYDHFGYREYVLQKMGGRPARDAAGRPVETRVHVDVDNSPIAPFEQLFLSGGGTCDETGEPFGAHPYDYVDNVSFHTGERVRILAFSQGASLSISQAIILADYYGLTPVTDSALHQQLLSMKYRRAQNNVSMLDQSIIPSRTIEMLERYSIVGRTVLMEALSPAFLQQISIADALKFRDANAESLERFRRRIGNLVHELDEVDLGADFNRRLTKVVDQVVLPELQLLEDKLQDSRRKIFGNLLSRGATTAVPASAAASLYAAFSGPALLALSVGAGVTAFGLSVATVVERWQERKKLGQDWLAFCVGLRNLSAS